MTRTLITGAVVMLALAGGVVSAQAPVKRQAVKNLEAAARDSAQQTDLFSIAGIAV